MVYSTSPFSILNLRFHLLIQQKVANSFHVYRFLSRPCLSYLFLDLCFHPHLYPLFPFPCLIFICTSPQVDGLCLFHIMNDENKMKINLKNSLKCRNYTGREKKKKRQMQTRIRQEKKQKQEAKKIMISTN